MKFPLVNYIKEVASELRKVSFPSRKEVVAGSIVVIITIVVASTVIAFVDAGIIKLLKLYILK